MPTRGFALPGGSFPSVAQGLEGLLLVRELPEWRAEAATSKPLPAEVGTGDEQERPDSPPRLPS